MPSHHNLKACRSPDRPLLSIERQLLYAEMRLLNADSRLLSLERSLLYTDWQCCPLRRDCLNPKDDC
jgi:hypothetical protein